MRIIKFRAKLLSKWNTRNAGEWITFSPQDLDNNMGRLPIDWNTLGQFTGLKDRDDTEIYEGDILIDDETDDGIDYAVIEWFEGGWTAHPWFGTQEFFTDVDCYAVVGNIYENKELLK